MSSNGESTPPPLPSDDQSGPPPMPVQGEAEQQTPPAPKKSKKGCLLGCGALSLCGLLLTIIVIAWGIWVNGRDLASAKDALARGEYEEAIQISKSYTVGKEFEEVREKALIGLIPSLNGDDREEALQDLFKIDPDNQDFPDEMAAIALVKREAEEKALKEKQEQERREAEELAAKERAEAELEAEREKLAEEERAERRQLAEERRAKEETERIAREKLRAEQKAKERAEREAQKLVEFEAKKKTLFEESKARVSEVTWSQIDKIYSPNSNYTELQKKEEWKKYKGKTVEWRGTVEEISKTFGTLTLSIDMGSGDRYFSSDILVWLRDEVEAEAMQLRKGQRVTFRGELSKWGSHSSVTISGGLIVK